MLSYYVQAILRSVVYNMADRDIILLHQGGQLKLIIWVSENAER